MFEPAAGAELRGLPEPFSGEALLEAEALVVEAGAGTEPTPSGPWGEPFPEALLCSLPVLGWAVAEEEAGPVLGLAPGLDFLSGSFPPLGPLATVAEFSRRALSSAFATLLSSGLALTAALALVFARRSSGTALAFLPLAASLLAPLPGAPCPGPSDFMVLPTVWATLTARRRLCGAT